MCAISAHACAMFTVVSADGQVLFANNEDYIKPGYVWFVPGEKGKLGRVNVGFEDKFVQGSMNERGLCFDAAALPEVPWSPDPKKKDSKNLLELIMDRCGTVEEALAIFDEYNCKHLATGQFMFADATGASAVVTWDPRGHISIVQRTQPYLLNTNDRLAWSGLRDERFVLAERMLRKDAPPSVERCAEVLAAIRQCGKDAYTSYSNVFEPKTLQLHIYQLGDFENRVTFNLRDELDKGAHRTPVKDLFTSGPKLEEVLAMPRREYPTEVTLAPELLAKYAGTYTGTEPAFTVRITVDATRGLLFQPEGQRVVGLRPESDTGFRFRETFGTLTFKLRADGSVEGLTMHRPGDVFLRRTAE